MLKLKGEKKKIKKKGKKKERRKQVMASTINGKLAAKIQRPDQNGVVCMHCGVQNKIAKNNLKITPAVLLSSEAITAGRVKYQRQR